MQHNQDSGQQIQMFDPCTHKLIQMITQCRKQIFDLQNRNYFLTSENVTKTAEMENLLDEIQSLKADNFRLTTVFEMLAQIKSESDKRFISKIQALNAQTEKLCFELHDYQLACEVERERPDIFHNLRVFQSIEKQLKMQIRELQKIVHQLNYDNECLNEEMMRIKNYAREKLMQSQKLIQKYQYDLSELNSLCHSLTQEKEILQAALQQQSRNVYRHSLCIQTINSCYNQILQILCQYCGTATERQKLRQLLQKASYACSLFPINQEIIDRLLETQQKSHNQILQLHQDNNKLNHQIQRYQAFINNLRDSEQNQFVLQRVESVFRSFQTSLANLLLEKQASDCLLFQAYKFEFRNKLDSQKQSLYNQSYSVFKDAANGLFQVLQILKNNFNQRVEFFKDEQE